MPIPELEPKDLVTERHDTREWQSMSPGEKQAWLLNQALDCKRGILTMPLPDPDDYSAEAIRMRALILAAADSTIEQTIRLQANQLKPPAADDGIAEIIEERRQKALEQIARMSDGLKPPKPN
jgi:hypothetical protein